MKLDKIMIFVLRKVYLLKPKNLIALAFQGRC